MWWWSGGRRRRSSGGTPPALNLPTTGTIPTTWYLGLLPCKQLAFQPGPCSCGCQDWSDAFSRIALGDDWEAVSGTWTPAVGVGLTPSADGTLLATRSVRTKCHPKPAVWLVMTGAASTVRLYCDYLDEDNHHYVELAWTTTSTPAGGTRGVNTLSIYRVLDGVAELLAGPEDLDISDTSIPPSPWTLAVQFSDSGVAGEVYLQAMFTLDDVLNAEYINEEWVWHQWVACTTELVGNRCGIAITSTDYNTDDPVFTLFRVSDCIRGAMDYCMRH